MENFGLVGLVCFGRGIGFAGTLNGDQCHRSFRSFTPFSCISLSVNLRERAFVDHSTNTTHDEEKYTKKHVIDRISI